MARSLGTSHRLVCEGALWDVGGVVAGGVMDKFVFDSVETLAQIPNLVNCLDSRQHNYDSRLQTQSPDCNATR